MRIVEETKGAKKKMGAVFSSANFPYLVCEWMREG
jgi:hypothetical protein